MRSRGMFELPGPNWVKVLLLGVVLVEWGIWKTTGLQVPSARWGK